MKTFAGLIALVLSCSVIGCVSKPQAPTSHAYTPAKGPPEPATVVNSKKSRPKHVSRSTNANSGSKPLVASPVDEKASFVLDLTAGKIFGAVIGMDEATVRRALEENHITEIQKVEYPEHFLLQSKDCGGIIFNFRGKHELNDIYTNQRTVRLSNGLRLGQSIDEFSAKLGLPLSIRKLPSKVGDELVYHMGDFDLGIIRLNENPEVAHALVLRKQGLR